MWYPSAHAEEPIWVPKAFFFFFLNVMKEKIKVAFCVVANEKLTNLYEHLASIQSIDIHWD